MHPLVRVPYAVLGGAAELATILVSSRDARAAKWRRALAGRRGLRARLTAFGAMRDDTRPLAWFHAPSVGESLMALPVMQALRAAHPHVQLAYTWFSPSAEGFASRFDADFKDYLPFDTGRGARAALDALRPAALIYVKLDVWPLLTERAASRGARLGLIAATLAESSRRRRGLARAALAGAYARLDAAGAVSADDAERLVDLGVRREAIAVTGDTRYDQVWARAQAIDRTSPPVAHLATDRPTLVAGSTWPADEAVLFDAWRAVRASVPGARLIVAPHEPTQRHVAPLAERARSLGLTVALESLGAPPSVQSADVVIIDRVGALGEVYAAATAAFVGGGFHRFGLHSVLEPAALGAPVAFGPGGASNRDAVGLASAGGGVLVDDAAELAARVGDWLRNVGSQRGAGAAAAQFVRSGLGAAARSVALVEGLLG